MARQHASHASTSPEPQRGRTRYRRSKREEALSKSQQMLNVPRVLKKAKTGGKDLGQLRAKVAADQEELKKVMEESIWKAEEATSRHLTTLTNTLTAALTTATPTANHPTSTFRVSNMTSKSHPAPPVFFPGTFITRNPLYTLATQILESTACIYTTYIAVERTIAEITGEKGEDLGEQWSRDMVETEGRLRLGARVAGRRVKRAVGVEGGGEQAGKDEEGAEKVKEVDGLEDNVEGSEEGRNEMRRTLGYVERGVKRMVKGIPDKGRL